MSDSNNARKARDAMEPGQAKVDIGNSDIPQPEGQPVKTIASMLGDIVWIMSQSPAHKFFALADLEWMVMPPLVLNQYRVFRDDKKPVGVAFWAYLSEESENKIQVPGVRLRPDEWKAGSSLSADKGIAGGEGGSLWLMELICPFATAENKLMEKCLADLMQTAFKGKSFKFHRVDPNTKERKILELKG